jgi:hypothetical protein
MPTSNARPQLLAPLTQALFILALVWTALYFAWVSLSGANFLYPVWYRVLAIDAHIAQYAPQNYYKRGFETTDVDQHRALFAEMVQAINRGGEGLAQMRYVTAEGRSVQLLREPERAHLESVALLLDRLRWVSWFMLGVLALSALLLWRLRAMPPPPLRVLAWSLAVVLVLAAAVLLYGPQEVFDAAHELVFPPDDQWFFYYQESLMTTLLKAPDLFAALAVLLVATALAWFALLLWGSRRLFTYVLRRS